MKRNDMKKTYPVNEIFYSLQGEGYFTGTPAVFVRMSGCNRACKFCDTDFSASTPMEAAEIVEKVCGFPARHVVVTGGEPLLHLDSELIEALHKAGCFIQIETNGSLPVPAGVDWITCSPKEQPWNIGDIDELKIVYQNQDLERFKERFKPRKAMFLQPCSCLNTTETVGYILEHPWWRLSLQTHKLADFK